jgi:hypothetical protein
LWSAALERFSQRRKSNGVSPGQKQASLLGILPTDGSEFARPMPIAD